EWGGGVEQQAVDGHAVWLVFVPLLRRLPVFALRQRLLLLADEPGLDRGQLAHEVTDLDDEVANDRKVAERLHANRAWRVVGQERGAGELGLAIDGHAAAATDAHPAGPALRQRAVHVILDVVEA